MEIKLSDGRTARIKEGKGKDLFWAMEHANSQNEIMKLLTVRLVEIDGKPMSEDELENMPIADALTLLNEVGKLVSPFQAQKPSSA